MRFPFFKKRIIPNRYVATPWFPSIVISAAMVGAWFAPRASDAVAPYLILLAFLASVAAAAVAGFEASAGTFGRRATLAATPAILSAAGFGLFLVIDTRAERIAVALATLGFIAAYVAYARGVTSRAERFSHADFAHVSAAVHAAAVYLAFAFAMTGTEYTRLPFAAIVAIIACVLALVTYETFRRSGVLERGSIASWGVAALVTVGTQFFVALTFLPTAYLANAAVGAIVYATLLHAAIDILDGRADERAMRRQVSVAAALVVLILSTARWF